MADGNGYARLATIEEGGSPKYLSRSKQGTMVLQGDTYLWLAILKEQGGREIEAFGELDTIAQLEIVLDERYDGAICRRECSVVSAVDLLGSEVEGLS